MTMLIEGIDKSTKERLLYEWDGEWLSRVEPGFPNYVIGREPTVKAIHEWAQWYRGLEIVYIMEEP
jgi:hypothetical protein